MKFRCLVYLSTFVAFLLLEETSAFTPPLQSALASTKTQSTTVPPTTTPEEQQLSIAEAQALAEGKCRKRHNKETLRALQALFTSVPERPDPRPCIGSFNDNDDATCPSNVYGPQCQSTLPKDFPPGALLKIGPNGQTKNDGFLDGDGMVHCITFPPEDSTEEMNFSCTYVDTAGRQRERQLQEKSGNSNNKVVHKGTLGGAPRGWPLLGALAQNVWNFKSFPAQKDTCNTALAEHGGRVLALMEQAPPTEIKVTREGRVKTVECMTRLDGALPASDPITGGSFGAHGKTCPHTGERIHVTYGATSRPYIRVDTFEENLPDSQRHGWQLSRSVGVDIPTPVMMHDFCITSNYVVLMDFPLTLRPMRMVADKFPVDYEAENGARIGLLSRTADNSEGIRWFECDPGVVLHTVNAYETRSEDGHPQVVVQGLKSVPKDSYIANTAATFLHEWVLDLPTGKVEECCLNPNSLVEFPVMNENKLGQQEARYTYAIEMNSLGGPLKEVLALPNDAVTFSGVSKFSLVTDKTQGVKKGDLVDKFTTPKDWYPVSEPCVVPKKGVSPNMVYGDKEDAYVLLIVTHVPPDGRPFQAIAGDEVSMKSHLLILDADDLSSGPVAAFELPSSVRYGLHGMFLDWDKMKEEQ